MSTSNQPITLSPVEREQRRLEERQALRAGYHNHTVPGILHALQAAEPDAGWQLEANLGDHQRTILAAAAGGERLHLSLDEYDKRISISGLYGQKPSGGMWLPRDVYRLREMRDPRITVGASRAPAAQAAEILRRVLPTYRQLLGEYRAYVAQERAHAGGLASLCEELGTLSGGRLNLRAPQHSSPTAQRTAYVPAMAGIHHATVTVSSADYVRVEMTVDAAVARQLAAWLAAQPLAERDA